MEIPGVDDGAWRSQKGLEMAKVMGQDPLLGRTEAA